MSDADNEVTLQKLEAFIVQKQHLYFAMLQMLHEETNEDTQLRLVFLLKDLIETTKVARARVVTI